MFGDNDFTFKAEEPNSKMGKAFFLDLDGMPCPPNEDTTQRIRNREYDIQLTGFTFKWKELDKRRLEKYVRKVALDKLKEPLLNRKRDLEEQLEEISAANSRDVENSDKIIPPAGGKSVAKIKQQMKEVKEQLTHVKGEPLKAILRNPRANINWQYIASEYFEDRHDEYECRGMWHNLLSPTVSQSTWSEKETQCLLEIATMFNFQDWDNIAIQLNTNRTAFQCFQQFQKTLNKSRHEWSNAEDKMLKHCVRRFKKDRYIPFREIATYIPGRSALQCQQRWNSMLNPAVFQGKFKQVEDAIIYEARKANLSFKQIAYMLPGRTQDQLRYRWGRLQLEMNFRPWTKEEDDLLIRMVKEQAEVNRVSFTALVPHFDRRNRHMLRSRYVCLLQNNMAVSRKRTSKISVHVPMELLNSESSSEEETFDLATIPTALNADEGMTMSSGSSSSGSMSAASSANPSTSGTPARSMPLLMATSPAAATSAKSLSTSTASTTSGIPPTSTAATLSTSQASTASGKPITNTAATVSGKPSTSTASTTSGKPITNTASTTSGKPSTSTASSGKPPTRTTNTPPTMPIMTHIKTGFNKLIARHTSLMGRKNRSFHPIEPEICSLFYSYYPQMSGRVRRLFSSHDIRYLSGEIQQLMEMLQTSLDWTKGESLVSNKYVATYMVHRCIEVKREEKGEKRQMLPSRDTRLLNLMPPNITTLIGIRTLLLEMSKLKDIIDKKRPWNPTDPPATFEAKFCSTSSTECNSTSVTQDPSYIIKLNQWDPISTRTDDSTQSHENPSSSDEDVYMNPHVAVSLFKQRFYSLFYWASTMNSVRARVYEGEEEEPQPVKPVKTETERKPKLSKNDRKRMLKERWKNYRKEKGEAEEELDEVKGKLTIQGCNFEEPGRKRRGKPPKTTEKNKDQLPLKRIKIEPGLEDSETMQQPKEKQQ
ncbi:hypothetical protein B566_EDAN005093 [Ephemera danica]|nr:hypothetical protein B566_EDAN005093 [Ephemera danica]